MSPLRVEVGDGFQWKLMLEPSLNNSSEWVIWQADQVDTPTWWPKLSTVPRERDVQEFTRKVWASFELPKKRSHTQSTPMITPHPHPSCPGQGSVPPD